MDFMLGWKGKMSCWKNRMMEPTSANISELSSSFSTTNSAQKYVFLYLVSNLSRTDFSESRLFLELEPALLKSIYV